jgi:gamma-glutamylcyclotransferase (GGCT)/AIG2-like uncharacterized protein YtfP
MIRLFVYGSLKQGFHNASYLESACFLGEHSTGPEFSMYDFGTYPAVCASGTTRIIGELYEINEQHLASTDRLEWYPDFYRRVLIETGHGEAWMYVVSEQICEDKIVLPGIWP